MNSNACEDTGLRRVCNTCEQDKPIGAFDTSRCSNGNVVHRHRCRKCAYRLRKERWVANPFIRRAHLDGVSRRAKKYRNDQAGWCRHITGNLRHKAKQLGLPFDITIEYLMSIFPSDGKCPALGMTLQFGRKSRWNPSVDRLKPELGYVKGNVAIISVLANVIKQDVSSKEIFGVANWLKSVEQAA